MRSIHWNIILLIIASGITIVVARMRCAPVTLSNGSAKTKSRGRIISFKCYRGYMMLGEPYAACIRGKWDPDPPVCLKPGCSPVRNFKNGHITESKRSALLEFSCNPGYKLVGPSFIYCNGKRWSAMQPYCKAADITCNFESDTACSWSIETHDDDDFMWHVQQHEAPSRILGTGPKTDHTFSTDDTGHYLMIETSEYGSGANLLPARIHSPKFPVPSTNDTCFIFWYHMFGATVGMLNIFLNNKVVFQEKDNHGDRWIKGVVPLPQNGTDLQIIIEGTYGGEHTGDIGLDDFSIGSGSECTYSKVTSCEGMCDKTPPETATCFCNPECFVDSSCCQDYDQFCNAGSSAAVSLDTDNYDSESSGSSPSIPSEESTMLETEIVSLSSTNIIDSSDVSTSQIDEDMFLSHSTRDSTDISSSLSSQEDKLTPSESTLSTEQYTNVHSTKQIYSAVPTEQTQASIKTSTTPLITLQTNKELITSVTVNETLTKTNFLTKGTASSLEINTTEKTNVQTTPTQLTESTARENTVKLTSKLTSTSITLPTTTAKSVPLNNFTLSTVPSKTSPSKYNITSSTISRLKTVTTHSFLTKSTQVRQALKNSTRTKRPKTTTKSYLSTATKNVHTTKTTTVTPKRKFKSTTTKKLLKPTTLSLGVTSDSLYNVKKVSTIKQKPTAANITKMPTTKSRIKPVPTASYTRPQKPTAQSERRKTTLVYFKTTEKTKTTADMLSNGNEPMQTADSSVGSQPGGKSNSSVGVNLHHLNTPKEKLQLAPKEVNDSTSVIKEVIISGVCVIIILAGGILIGVFIVKRRRLRFVNDSEGDVLYASSEEMLDLHLARPILRGQ